MSSSSAFSHTRERPYEVFFTARKAGRQYKILHCHPGAPHQIDKLYPNVVRFCFPDRPKPRPGDPPMKALRFTFVLTNEYGRRMFGHVFQPLSGDMICFVSKFCWVELFDEIFYRFRMNGENMDSIVAFYQAQVPGSHGVFCSPGHLLSSSSSSSANGAAAAASSSSSATSIAEGLRRPADSGNAFANVRLASVLELVSNDTLLRALAALMCESRIVVVGRRCADISDVVLGLVALLQPFDWEHVLIPVLPNDLLDVLCSPTPFLMGLLTTQVAEASRLPMEDVTVVVLGRDGGEGSFVRKGIPELLEHHESLNPTSPIHPHAMSTSFVPSSKPELTAEQRRELLSGGVGGGSMTNYASGYGGDNTEETLYNNSFNSEQDSPILILPFTDSSFSSIRVGLFQARRKHEAGPEHKQAADEILLAAFHDYYVFTFGLVFAADFTPQNFCVRMMMRGGDSGGASGGGGGGGSSASAAELNTREFFDRVSQGMMLADMRAGMTERLLEADKRAVEIKKRHLNEMELLQQQHRVGSTMTLVSVEEKKKKKKNAADDDDDDDDDGHRHVAFKPSISDVYQIRRIIRSEFLEAVLERYPLLYPHAAQILAHGTQEAEEEKQDGSNNDARTVAKLEDSSLLRRFVSWCSYGVTSTVQKLETRSKNLMQARAELEEL